MESAQKVHLPLTPAFGEARLRRPTLSHKGRGKLKDYLELTKPRVTGMVLCTTWLGFSLGARRMASAGSWVHTLLGTYLAAAGAAALNQYLERDVDAKMRRTQNRPLPAGRLTPGQGLAFGAGLAAAGTLELALFANMLAGCLTALTLITYLFAYTPLKKRTALCTLVGAVPGALPPMIGWAGAQGRLAPEAWILFGILFLWQLPHFLAIAWMYREDYARAGFPMLPVIDPNGSSTARMILLYSAILIPVSLLPACMGVAGFSYFLGALMLGLAFLSCGACTAYFRTPLHAKRLMLASVIYLPALLAWMVVSKTL